MPQGYQLMITKVKFWAHNCRLFSIEIPNLDSREAMREAIEGKRLKVWPDLEALKRGLS
jgi:hypothetical protein